MIESVNIPCYCRLGEQCQNHKLTVREFAGRVVLVIESETDRVGQPVIIRAEFSFDDLTRAWNAVKKY